MGEEDIFKKPTPDKKPKAPKKKNHCLRHNLLP